MLQEQCFYHRYLYYIFNKNNILEANMILYYSNKGPGSVMALY